MKKYILSLFLFTIFTNFSYGYEKQDAQNVFDFKVFDHYESQMKSFVKEKTKDKMISFLSADDESLNFYQSKVIQLIDTILNPIDIDQCAYHQKVIHLLRESITAGKDFGSAQDNLTQEINDFIQQFCVWMYTEVHIDTPWEQFLFCEVVDEPAMSSPKSFSSIMEEIFTKTQQDLRFNSSQSRAGILDDSHLFGDIPSYLFTFDNPQKTKMIRTTSVVRDLELDPTTGRAIKATVCEEFAGYLEALKHQNKKHLYVNLMTRSKGHEKLKSNLIENLERNESFGSNIYVLSLDKGKGNTFYMQCEEYEEANDAAVFKETFLNLLFQEDGFFYISSHLNKEEFKQRIKDILDSIHKEYFNNAEELTVLERQDFVELGYLKIIEAVIDIAQVDYINSTCRYSLDRGPSVFSLLYIDQKFKGETNFPDMFKRFLTYVFAPSLLIHNRVCHTYRINRIQTVGERLLDHKS